MISAGLELVVFLAQGAPLAPEMGAEILAAARREVEASLKLSAVLVREEEVKGYGSS